ncbi:MAG: acyltransferase family protein, partial [Christensenellales bacterium]
MSTKKSYPAVDIFRLAAAFLVVAVHISPLASVSGTVDFIFTRIIARIAVPFFLMATGFFLLPGFAKGTDFIFGDRLKKFFQKTLLLYGAATAIYLPVNLYAGHLTGASTAADVLKAIVFDGTFYHLWYLPALLIGVPIAALLLAKCRKKTALMAAVLLYALGLLGDSYYGLAQMIPPVRFLYDNVLFHLFGYTRNGLFYAPLFLMMGASLGAAEKRPSRAALGAGLAASFSLMTLEALLLKAARWQRHDSMYVMLPPVMFFLFSLLVSVRGTARPHLRDFSMAVYIVHPLALVMVRGAARAAGLTPVIV